MSNTGILETLMMINDTNWVNLTTSNNKMIRLTYNYLIEKEKII